MANARRITALALAATGQPPVFLKGFSVFALTGERRHIRASDDLDVLTAAPGKLCRALLDSGYEGEDRTAHDSHELAVLRDGEGAVDIHRYFPVATYPAWLSGPEAGRLLAAHSGLRFQPPRHYCSVKSVAYGDLVGRLAREDEKTPEAADLPVLAAAASAFILCAHEFRTYVEPVFWRPFCVTLGTLADVYDLALHPRFDPRAFWTMVDRFRGHDSVRLVRYLLDRFFGTDPFAAGMSSTAPAFTFPRSLTSFGVWAMPQAPDDLLVPLDTTWVFDALGTNVVPLSTDCSLRHYGSDPGGEGRPVEHAVIQSVGRETLSFSFACTEEGGVLTATVILPEPLTQGEAYDVEFISYSGSKQVMQRVAIAGRGGQMQLKREGWGNVAVAASGVGYIARLSLPLLELDPRGGPYPMLLVIVRRKTGSRPLSKRRERLGPVVLVPLLVCPRP
jgi:hypothetical protein